MIAPNSDFKKLIEVMGFLKTHAIFLRNLGCTFPLDSEMQQLTELLIRPLMCVHHKEMSGILRRDLLELEEAAPTAPCQSL